MSHEILPHEPAVRGAGTALRAALTSAIALPVILLGLLAPGEARAQGVAYSVYPSAEQVRWDDAWGFDRSRFWSVRLGFDFGPLVSLQPFYAWRDEVGIRDDYEAPVGADLPEFWEVDAYGADVQFNLGTGDFVPFIRGGGGVLRIDDGENDREERILLRAGGGLKFGLGSRASAELYAENWWNRLSEPYLPEAVDQEDIDDDGIVSSLVLGAGIRVPFGGDDAAWEMPGRAFLPGVFLEPFAARLDFDDELEMERQYMAGARGGLDINRNVGLRAFYWRGVDSDFSDTEPISGYGAETQFNFNTGPGISPFGVVGVGRIDFRDEFENELGETPGDETHLILGGGLSFGLGDRTRLQVGARNFLMSLGEDLEDVTVPDELRSNWSYSAGLSVGFGAEPRTEREQELERELERERERRRAQMEADEEADEADPRMPQEVREAPGDGRVIMVPVPEVGEVILRYGEAYAARLPDDAEVSAQDASEIEQAVAAALEARGVVAGDLEQRLPEIVRQVVREELQAMDIDPGAAPDPDAPDPVQVPGLPRTLNQLEPYSGLQPTSPTQVIVGIRADMGRVTENVPLELVPELAFGVGGDDPSLMLAVNARYAMRDLGLAWNLEPYLIGGAALTNADFIRLNLGYGAEFDLTPNTRLFAEHQGIGFFDEHRFLVGVSLLQNR